MDEPTEAGGWSASFSDAYEYTRAVARDTCITTLAMFPSSNSALPLAIPTAAAVAAVASVPADSAYGLQPQPDVARDEVDLIEINHFHDEQGRLVFDQVIFYDWSPMHSRYLVRAWRLLKTKSQIPVKDWEPTERFNAIWHDGDTLRKVSARVLKETWTQHDPELVAREYLPKEKRRELLPVKMAINTRNP